MAFYTVGVQLSFEEEGASAGEVWDKAAIKFPDAYICVASADESSDEYEEGQS